MCGLLNRIAVKTDEQNLCTDTPPAMPRLKLGHKRAPKKGSGARRLRNFPISITVQATIFPPQVFLNSWFSTAVSAYPSYKVNVPMAGHVRFWDKPMSRYWYRSLSDPSLVRLPYIVHLVGEISDSKRGSRSSEIAYKNFECRIWNEVSCKGPFVSNKIYGNIVLISILSISFISLIRIVFLFYLI